ncbi:MAG: mandelate racemase/muconate lactonizing enzyme family protein [Abditibacteriales bacterium]|nr:mandelate racemase/muconate lactonizing enzyme family protein [Abditibacteriales bacterium]MDW8366245.1 mandelate racemase/muconate lactonizing enzyme family protein [Abditibacteriales bacterium]
MGSWRITRIRVLNAIGDSPKMIGCNARLPNHGAQTRDPIVRLETDVGIEGIGRLRGGMDAADRELPQLIGRDVFEFYDPEVGVVGTTAAEFAMWDVVAKSQGKPVYALLGDAGSNDVDAYDGGLYFCDLLYPDRPLERVCEEAAESVARGFRAIKMKVGRGHKWMEAEEGFRRDVECVAAVRETIGPNVKLMVDANNGYDVSGAMRLFREIGQCDIYWAEEMFPETVEDYRVFRDFLRENGWNTLIADGETQGEVTPLLPLMEAGLLDALQLDINRVGLTEWKRLAGLCKQYRCCGAPHTWSSQFGLFISLHLGRAFDNFLAHEVPAYNVDAILPAGIEWYGGQYHFTGAPGWGVVVNERVYNEKYRGEEKVYGGTS